MSSETNQVVKWFDRMFNILEKMMDFQKQIMDRQAIHIKLIRKNENKINNLYCILGMVVLLNILVLIWSGI